MNTIQVFEHDRLTIAEDYLGRCLTKLQFEKQHIDGKLMLLITNESVLWIQKALDKLIEEYN